ncbi:YndM family protein [Mesobacillus subterraneus]|uniref:YndM family protein n=1 Tax=Mesobacillus subterraneus TaxID=285983 RepID=UPI00203E7E8B|nr:YndM family protein [Mesobacillus subterraneus]MCM3575130.1 YndM family protein [Mesobacillus subterraneus]
MKHLRALAVKFLASLVLLYVILGLMYDMSFTNVFLISLVLGLASYVIGDLFLLPKTNNTIATLADFGLAFMIIWILGESLTYGESLLLASLISAAGIALFEYFFHKYVAGNVLEDGGREYRNTNYQYQTEAAEELYPVKPDVRSEEDTKE